MVHVSRVKYRFPFDGDWFSMCMCMQGRVLVKRFTFFLYLDYVLLNDTTSIPPKNGFCVHLVTHTLPSTHRKGALYSLPRKSLVPDDQTQMSFRQESDIYYPSRVFLIHSFCPRLPLLSSFTLRTRRL